MLIRPTRQANPRPTFTAAKSRANCGSEEDGAKGELSCPRVTNDKRDTHFSVVMHWEFVSPS